MARLQREPVMFKSCYLAKLAATAALYLVAMPSPAAAELISPSPTATAARCGQGDDAAPPSVDHAAGKPARPCKDKWRPTASARPVRQ